MFENLFFWAWIATFVCFLMLCLFFWLTVKAFDQAIDLASRSLGFQIELLEEHRRMTYDMATSQLNGTYSARSARELWLETDEDEEPAGTFVESEKE